jgi:zinc protease
MFSETRNHPHGEFDRLMEGAGAEANAATWTDWTCYYENAPRDALPLLIELEADRMSNLVLRVPQVTSEKEVVANERKLRVDDDVEGKALEMLYDNAFRRHPYRWPTIGSMQDIRGFTVRDCQEFYRTHYAPGNATVVIAGDFTKGSFARAKALWRPVRFAPSETPDASEGALTAWGARSSAHSTHPNRKAPHWVSSAVIFRP